MANLPDSLYEDYTRFMVNFPSASASPPPPNIRMIIKWVDDLHNEIPSTFDFALQNLTIHRTKFEILPRLLWKSRFTVAMMLQEITNIYPYTSRPVYSLNGMHLRVYNILLLFQCITHHPDTRSMFLTADMANYFYPLMDISLTDKPLECLRLGALGVIAHMLKPPVDVAVVRYLTKTNAVEHCTKAIAIGSAESKTLAVFILNKILFTDEGLHYCCACPERFFTLDGLLKMLLVYLTTMTTHRPSLFNLVVGCYAKLSYKPRFFCLHLFEFLLSGKQELDILVCIRARRGLRRYPPVMLFNGTFASLLDADPPAERYRQELIKNVQSRAGDI
ncbi:unnamed protein product [Eruca vesicaria subsp. sativa]|uniref:Rcd1-like protein n=1 Tax=Eruca vesicaria subsp. sativa TaxID=29727 RepID=A0ABC8L6K4_ERUVS|nr:unnamed protein product [Eruca vesicaria subsp. sativa]